MTVYHRYEHSIKAKGCFLDTNIIIFCYFNLDPDDSRVHFYNTRIRYLLDNGIDCYISPTVISETINKWLRIEQSNYYEENPKCTEFIDKFGNRDFKKYRNSTHGITAYNDIAYTIKNDILKDFKVKPDKLSKSDISKFILDSHTLDFNDKYIADLCIKNNLILITHDKDFFDTKGLNIISMLSDNKK